MSAAPTLDLARLVESGIEEARKALSAGRFQLKVYALPRPRIRIRTPSKKILEIDEGKLARLEYALFRSVLAAKSRGTKPSFREFADLVGDYKASAAYLAALWHSGLLEFEDPPKAVEIYIAASSLSQKGYERRIARALDAKFTLKVEELAKLPSDQIECIERDGRIYCRYILTNTARSQAKAQVRALSDVLSS